MTRPEELTKIYRLDGVGEVSPTESFHSSVGSASRQSKSLAQIEESILKAKSSAYDGVLLAHGALLSESGREAIRLIRERGIRPVISLPLDLARSSSARFLDLCAKVQEINGLIFFWIANAEDLVVSTCTLVSQFAEKGYDFFVTAVITRNLHLPFLLEWLPENLHERLRLYVPHHDPDHQELLREYELFDLLEDVGTRWPSFKPRMPRGLEIFDPRIPEDLELEPSAVSVCEVNRVARPEVSFIIPAFNNARHLLMTLRHLERQNAALGAFEVIVVDDGSTDETSAEALAFARRTQLPFSFLRIPRARPRQMGDNRFRAGIARNLGVKNARGPLLQFLDCDIIVGSDFVRTLIGSHAQGDLIQARRFQLTPEATLAELGHDQVVEGRDTYVPEGAYWETFQAQTGNWSAHPARWKYVSSFGLSVKTESFKRAGWFKKIHVWYGFEDTDLGLRLIADGARMLLSPSHVYHLYHRNERSEWRHSAENKHRLLSRSAKILYHHNLNREIFLELKSFMD